jgi:predicted DNA-binding transcriptional regulator YafY
MDMTTGIRLLRLLSSRPGAAWTSLEIAQEWRKVSGTEISHRSIQRYMQALSEDGPQSLSLVAVEDGDVKHRFRLRPSQVANWFMTEEAALSLQLTRQVLRDSFGHVDRAANSTLQDVADQVANASQETKRVRDRIRIVPDGIGRLRARIDPLVLKAATDAIRGELKLRISYENAAGKPSSRLLSPLGLVAKDGTIYLVAITGLADTPHHYALHRIKEANASPQPAQSRPDFDLDTHIRETHQFSHALDADAPPIRLVLKVAPETMFHFRERKLASDQTDIPGTGPDKWHIVTATVPKTVLLVPFLVGMGPWIEVLEPADVRAMTAKWLRDSAALYRTDSKGQ